MNKNAITTSGRHKESHRSSEEKQGHSDRRRLPGGRGAGQQPLKPHGRGGVDPGARARSRMRTRPPGSGHTRVRGGGGRGGGTSPVRAEHRAGPSRAAPRRAPAPPPALLPRRQEDAARRPADRPAARRALLPGRRSGNRRRGRWRRDCFRGHVCPAGPEARGLRLAPGGDPGESLGSVPGNLAAFRAQK